MEQKKNWVEFSKVEVKPTSLGLPQPVAAVLASLFGLVFVFIESKNQFVRYCAMLSLFVLAAVMVGTLVLGVFMWIPGIGLLFRLLDGLLGLAALGAVGVLAYNANNNVKIHLHVISKYAEEWARPDIEDDDIPPSDDPPALP